MFTGILFHYVLVALILINIIGLFIVALDKYKARKKFWRIPERAFFLIALLGGTPGVYLGLILFKHKTQHWYFMLGMPLIFVLQVIGLLFFRYMSF